MDPQRFDAISRALAMGASRRWFGRAIAGLGTGVLFPGVNARRYVAASPLTNPPTGPRTADDDDPPGDPPPGRPCRRHEDCDPGPEFQCQEGVCLLDEGVCADFWHDVLCVNDTICCKPAGRVECHCGDECGVHCTEHERCAKSLIGRWFCRCEAGYIRCDGACVEGTCCTDHQCALPNTVCIGANCICAEGFTDCGGACVDSQTDEAHCGACGQACDPDQMCCAGACVDVAPSSPFSDYTSNDDPDLPNPERGMYFDALPGDATIPDPANPGGPEIPDPRRQAHTIVPRWLNLADVCGTNLVWKGARHHHTTQVLKDYAEQLEEARGKGVKVLFRPRYDRVVRDAEGDDCHVPSTCTFVGGGSDKVFHANSLDRQKQHITTIAKMLAEYKDVIAFIQAGYLGNWGEWNTDPSRNCAPHTRATAPMLYCCTDRLAIIKHLVSTYVGAGIAQHIEMRTPVFAKEALAVNSSAAVGLHNDCFMSSSPGHTSDSGSYSNFFCCSPQPCDGPQHCEDPRQCQHREDCGSNQNFPNSAASKAWAKLHSNDFNFGGETCSAGGDGAGGERWRLCRNMIGVDSEPASLHMTYLNGDFVKAAVDTWEFGDAEGNTCYAEIRRRLGYRFEVRSIEYPKTVAADQSFQVRVQVANIGWAKLHKPRRAKVVLRRGSLAYLFEIPEGTGGAVATWAPDQTTFVSVAACPPPPGTYTVRLWIPDPDAVISDGAGNPKPEDPSVDDMQDPDKKRRIAYAVQLATKRNGANVFDPTTGENDLGVEIEVQ